MRAKEEARPEGRKSPSRQRSRGTSSMVSCPDAHTRRVADPLGSSPVKRYGSGARPARLAVCRQSSRFCALVQNEKTSGHDTSKPGHVLRDCGARVQIGPGVLAIAWLVLPPGRAGPPRRPRSGGVRDASPRARKHGEAGSTAGLDATSRASPGEYPSMRTPGGAALPHGAGPGIFGSGARAARSSSRGQSSRSVDRSRGRGWSEGCGWPSPEHVRPRAGRPV